MSPGNDLSDKNVCHSLIIYYLTHSGWDLKYPLFAFSLHPLGFCQWFLALRSEDWSAISEQAGKRKYLGGQIWGVSWPLLGAQVSLIVSLYPPHPATRSLSSDIPITSQPKGTGPQTLSESIPHSFGKDCHSAHPFCIAADAKGEKRGGVVSTPSLTTSTTQLFRGLVFKTT